MDRTGIVSSRGKNARRDQGQRIHQFTWRIAHMNSYTLLLFSRQKVKNCVRSPLIESIIYLTFFNLPRPATAATATATATA